MPARVPELAKNSPETLAEPILDCVSPMNRDFEMRGLSVPKALETRVKL